MFDNYHVIVFELHVSRMAKTVHVISIACLPKTLCGPQAVIRISMVLINTTENTSLGMKCNPYAGERLGQHPYSIDRCTETRPLVSQ